jgi:hypothetical protein
VVSSPFDDADPERRVDTPAPAPDPLAADDPDGVRVGVTADDPPSPADPPPS